MTFTIYLDDKVSVSEIFHYYNDLIYSRGSYHPIAFWGLVYNSLSKEKKMNYRDKIISDNIAFCLRYKHFMNEWETSFVESVNSQKYDLTQKQFNRLQEVVARLTKELT